jgi:hypothetical protein
MKVKFSGLEAYKTNGKRMKKCIFRQFRIYPESGTHFKELSDNLEFTLNQEFILRTNKTFDKIVCNETGYYSF